ncbi:MAG: S41 family peptidase [Vulcanibacillus sp.]
MNLNWRKLTFIIIITIFLSSYLTYSITKETDLSVIDNNQENQVQEPDNLDKLIETYNKIQGQYIESTTSEELIDGAIQGMINSLGDRHSSYMDAEEAKQFYTPLDDSFEGIGAEVTMENGKVTIVAPIKGSPSEKAGIQPRDQIIKVNGESLEGLTLYEAVNKIRGPKGTEALLEVIRPSLTESVTISVIRDKIPNITVYSETISTREGLVGKIEISNFGENTVKEFSAALKSMEDNNIEGLILDLRGNPGGYLQSVLDIGDLLIPNNGIIVQIEDKAKVNTTYTSKLEMAKYPVVTLIDKGSASASEILAAALQEAGDYPVVGENSYGKGTVQNVYELDDGSNIKLTIAKWLTPDGNWINEKGVKPDIEVSLPSYYESMSFPEDVNLKYDDNSIHVKNLQLILNGLGYNPKREDGFFDKNTEVAVKAFQKAQGLNITGIVDTRTGNELQNKIVEKIKNPASDSQLQVAIETLLELIN